MNHRLIEYVERMMNWAVFSAYPRSDWISKLILPLEVTKAPVNVSGWESCNLSNSFQFSFKSLMGCVFSFCAGSSFSTLLSRNNRKRKGIYLPILSVKITSSKARKTIEDVDFDHHRLLLFNATCISYVSAGKIDSKNLWHTLHIQELLHNLFHFPWNGPWRRVTKTSQPGKETDTQDAGVFFDVWVHCSMIAFDWYSRRVFWEHFHLHHPQMMVILGHIFLHPEGKIIERWQACIHSEKPWNPIIAIDCPDLSFRAIFFRIES